MPMLNERKKGCFIITPDDEIWTAAYNNIGDACQIVGGYTESLGTKTIYSEREEETGCFVDVDFICNDNFLYERGFDKCNSIVAAILRKPIYGNVVLLPRDDDNDRGFDYIVKDGELQPCEYRIIVEYLTLFVAKNRLAIMRIHEECDRITQ